MFPIQNQTNVGSVQPVETKPQYQNSWILSGSELTLFVNGKSHTVSNDHVNYTQIVNAIKDGRFDDIEDLVNVKKAVENYGGGLVKIVDGVVHFNNEPMVNVMTDRLLDMMGQGFDINPLAKFIENLMQNPSRTAVNELYLFLESGKLPITPDGHFLAYKRVRDNFHDIYTGKFNHAPGSVLEMPRNSVDDKRDNTCSTGFHFCSIKYLPQFGGGNGDRVVIVKINPKDVVSIPSDYNNTKGRTCRYEVVGEYTGNWKTGVEAWTKAVADEDEEVQEYKPRLVPPVKNAVGYNLKELPVRDPVTGRFVKKYSSRWYELTQSQIAIKYK
jgi:hypothetical protein